MEKGLVFDSTLSNQKTNFKNFNKISLVYHEMYLYFVMNKNIEYQKD